MLILALRGCSVVQDSSTKISVSGIVKPRALNQKKIELLTEMLEIVLTPKLLGAPEIGGPRLKPF